MAEVPYLRETSEFDRSLSFFDAVYAFSLTLLIANLDWPPPAAWQNISTLLADGLDDQLIAFVISLVVIVVFWRSNQSIVARLVKLDSATINLNILVATIVIFIPFTTQAVGDPETADLTLPTVLYAVNVTAAIIAQMVMYRVAVAHRLERVPISPRYHRVELVNALFKPVVFVLSIPIAFVFGPTAGKLTWLLILLSPIIGSLTQRVIGTEEERPERPQAHT
jgi:uncharacterized membrane protein